MTEAVHFFKQKRSKNSKGCRTLKYLSIVSMLLVIAALLAIVLFILIRGIPNLSVHFLIGEHKARNVSILAPTINTIIMIVVTLAITLPIGISTAIFLAEYSRKNKFVIIVRAASETLSGIPSIVYAIFGMIFFVQFLGWGYSLKAGILTLSIMILPTIIRSTEESILCVDDSLREASYGIGAGKLRTVFKVVLPNAMRGIVASIILSIGRIVGESAAVIFTAGTTFEMITNGLNSQGASLAVAMFILIERGQIKAAYAAAVVLLITVIILNLLSTVIGKRLGEKNYGHKNKSSKFILR